LDECLLIRAVEIQVEDQHVDFYRDNVFAALRESGRRVTLDLHGAEKRTDLTRGAVEAGVSLNETHWELHETATSASAIQKILSSGVGGFEIDAPGPISEEHTDFYRFWGRLGYDPKTPLP